MNPPGRLHERARSMPRVPSPSPHRFAASPEAVRAAAIERLGGIPQVDGTVVVEAPPEQQPAIGVTIAVVPDGNGCHVTVTPVGGVDIPFFGFASALFGQLSGPIRDSFHASDSRISLLLALTRIGALLALPITVLADRRGRRRSILIGVAGSSIACAISAVAPNLLVFTSA